MRASPKTTPVSTRAIVLREVARPWRMAVLFVASLMHAAGHAGLALLGGAVVVALGGHAPMDTRSTGLQAANPFVLATFAIGVSSLRLMGSTLGAYMSERISGDVSTALRGQVLKGLFSAHWLRSPGQRDHGRECGEIGVKSTLEPMLDEGIQTVGAHARAVSALTARVREVKLALEGATAALRAGLQLLLLAAVIVVVAPRLFLMAAAVLAPFAVLLGRMRTRIRRAQRAEMLHAEALLEAADEAVRHDELWRTYGAERTIAEVLARLGREARDRSARIAALVTAQSGANELLGVVAVAGGLWALARFAPGEAAHFAPFAVPFFLAYRPLRDFAESRILLGRGAEAARDLDAVMAWIEPTRERLSTAGGPALDAWPLDSLTIEGLVHPHARWSSLDLTVAPGSIVALVGPTGCGKTTLIRMLLGLDYPTAGSVRYAGISLDDAPPGPQARPFAWVPQDAPVLAASLDDNVTVTAGLSPESKAKATPKSNHPLIAPSKVEPRSILASLGASTLLALGAERLGAGHRPLSGGERQWLSIARALATSQPVLLLDEPTSGLDAESERTVLRALASLRGTRTLLIVSHREACTAIADVVVRLSDGGSRARASTGEDEREREITKEEKKRRIWGRAPTDANLDPQAS